MSLKRFFEYTPSFFYDKYDGQKIYSGNEIAVMPVSEVTAKALPAAEDASSI